MPYDPTGYVSHEDELHRSQTWKRWVRCATTANITIATALNNGDTIDGVTLTTGDRVLVKNQSAGAENGIYVVGATPARAFDMDQDSSSSVPGSEVLGAVIHVVAGTANGGKLFRCTNTTAPTLGTTALTFAEITASATPGSLDSLTDVVITSAATGDRLRFDGSAWVNTTLIWKPVMDGLGNVVTDSGTGEAIMTEVVP